MKIKPYFVITLLAFFTLIILPRSFAQGPLAEPSVRLVYFLPNDRPARPDRIEALRQLIKDAQEFYAEQMESHGFGRKTFNVETDANGTPVVHRIDGKFRESHYYTGLSDYKIWEELFEHFDDLEHVYFIAIDLSQETLNDGDSCGLGAPSFVPSDEITPVFPFRSPSGAVAIRHRDITQKQEVIGGSLIIPVSGDCFEDNSGFQHRLGVTTHELGHTFGLEHDFRGGRWNNDTVMGGRAFHLSSCAAEWLSVSRFFNTNPISDNSPGEIKLLSTPTYSPAGIKLRFQVTDADGLHQAQLIVPENSENGSWGPYRLFDCKRLNGKNSTIEFVSSALTTEPVDRIMLQIIDVNGNITWATFLADIVSLLPAPKVVSIPDTNLAAAVRKALGLTPNARITDRQMRELINLDAQSSQIKNLTGLEYATKLKSLELRKNQIQDIRPLANLKNLKELILEVNNVRDISPLANLTQLTLLYIAANPIPDFTPLANLTELRRLALWDNNISDVTLIADKVHLTHLHLWNNNISDISSLSNLTQLQVLHLEKNQIRDVSPLSGLTNLTELTLRGNPIADKSPLRTLKDRNPELKLDIEIPQPSPIVYIDTAQRPPLYWIDTASGTLYRLVGAEVKNLVPNVRNATDLAIDMTGGKLYWTERTSDRTGKIRQANLDGTNVQLVKELTSVPHGIALDAAGDKIYLTNSWGKVQRLNVDGSNFESNLITGLEDLKDIAVDVVNHKVYWTEKTSDRSSRIRCANLDGSNVQQVKVLTNVPLGIAIDTSVGKIYLMDTSGKVQRLNVDGSNFQPNFITGLKDPKGIALDVVEGKVYWTEKGSIRRASFNGENIEEVATDLGSPVTLVLGMSPSSHVPSGTGIQETMTAPSTDINEDGKVNKSDLLLVVTALGEVSPTNPRVDVDGDGRVAIADLLLVVENLDDPVVGAAPAITTLPISVDVQALEAHLNLLRVLSDGSHKYQYAIAMLEGFLASMRPTETQLLANYPNPFNPETWIPYQLSEAADVRLNIYSATGTLIRTFELGHQPAGIYQNPSRAAYWDGRNELGEEVASGVYFYTLSAGDFTATRKMLIRK